MVEVEGRLGACLARQRRFDEAERVLLESLAALREERGMEHESTQQILDWVVSLYEAWGRPDDEMHYRKLLSAQR
jgi:hypothetical protein